MFSVRSKHVIFIYGLMTRVPRIFQSKFPIEHNQRRTAVSGDVICPGLLQGIDHLKDARLNKGLAFTLAERQALGIHGLLPAGYRSQEEQLETNKVILDAYKDDLSKYIHLVELQDRNEKLFFSFLATDIEKYLPIVYTPTVGLACQKFGLIHRRARGLFINIHDKGHVYDVITNWPESDVRAIVVTDGERILGLGDLGAYGMGIPVGKLALYTALAGIKPHQCLPITLDVGTNNETLLHDPLYVGLRQKRVRGNEYDDFVGEFMEACVRRYGQYTLIQFEDFGFTNAARLLKKYREDYCTFNDDIQGTAGVVVAGVIAAQRITKIKIQENIYTFLGAGSAAIGIANLLVEAMVESGISKKEAEDRVYLFDIDGLLTKNRKTDISEQAQPYTKDMPDSKDFVKCLATLKTTCLIGCSTVGGAFNAEVLKQMGKNCERPIIFALSNPTSKVECTPMAAYEHTDGRCVYSSGSPFDLFEYKGRKVHTGQGNNSYIFPGVALGVIASYTHHIPDKMFLTAASTLAKHVNESDLELGRVYPPLSQIMGISFAIAIEIAKISFDTGLSCILPKPKDMSAFLKKHLYSATYSSQMPTTYDYPETPTIKMKGITETYLRKPVNPSPGTK